MPARITVWIAVCGESAGGAGVRLHSGGDVGPCAQPGNICGNAGDRQVDWQCERTTSGVLEEVAGAKIHRDFYRSGILLQCGRVDVSGLSFAGSLCEE